MPDLPRQKPGFGSELPPIIAHEQLPGVATEPVEPQGESIGEYLRRNRQRLGIALADISRASKIQTRHLIAIENDAFEELPGRAYAIGFVRSYAACLGLDARAYIARLKAEMAGPDVDGAVAAPNSPACTDQARTTPVDNGEADPLCAEARARPRWVWLAGAAQTTFQLHKAMAVRRFKEIAKYSSELKLVSSSAQRKIQVAAATPNGEAREPRFDLFPATTRRNQTRSPNVPPRTAPPLFPTLERNALRSSPPNHPMRNWLTAGLMAIAVIYFGSSIVHSGLRTPAPPLVVPVPARLAAEAAFIPEKVAPMALATPDQPVHSAPAPEAVAPPRAEPPQAPALAAVILPESAIKPPTPAKSDMAAAEPKHIFRGQLPLGERYGEQNRGSRITLRLHRPTFVAVLGTRNHQYIDRVLRAGDTYRVPNMRGLKLNARDAGAVEVILDGNTVGFAGDDGASVKGMSLQPRSIVTRFHWQQE